MNTKKSIFYFEDEPELLRDYFRILRMKYNVIVGASQELIEQERLQPMGLLVVDLLIHHSGFDESEKEVMNITYPDVKWQRTGLEFLKRVRAGDYERFGFPALIPVVAATAVIDSSTREEIEGLGIKKYLEKPFSVDKLEKAIDSIIGE